MRLGQIDLNAYDVIDSNKLERDLCEKPVPTFSHPALAQNIRRAWRAVTTNQGRGSVPAARRGAGIIQPFVTAAA
jgi:hypothetical protein